MTIKKRAGALSKSALVRLVSSLYGMDEHVDDIIDRHLAGEGEDDEANSLVVILTHQMEHLREEDDFVSYRSSYAFASQLASILADINNLLRNQDLAQALRLTEDFLWLSDHSLERADDSDGYLGDVFREAADQWLNIAAELRAAQPGAENWVEKVLHFFNQNDYGCFDNVIAHSRNLLTEQELRQLASLYYATLLNWVSAFEAAQQTLAAIICYRALLTDLLDRGYSRAYHHGARYFHKLLALDKRLDDYQGVEDAQAFIRRLQTKHWRKRSFWDEAGYPNKPGAQA